MEIDLYSEKHKLGIEINGIYRHSSEFKDKDYHLEKTITAEQAGIQLLHFWDIELENNFDLVKSMIASRLGRSERKIYARKCFIGTVENKIRTKFEQENHLQGPGNSSVNLGLYLDTGLIPELVAVMTFAKPRFNKKYDWELIRFCSLKNTNVIGGASKLFKYFLEHYEGSIITYANRRFSRGNLYRNLGFTENDPSAPNYWYIIDGELVSRNRCQKHKLSKLLGDKFDSSLSESENMKRAGYHKIYDCGNLVFTYER